MTELTQQERSELRRSVESRKSEYGRLVADAERLAEVEAALQEEIDIRNRLEQVIRQQNGDGSAANFAADTTRLQRILDGGEKDG